MYHAQKATTGTLKRSHFGELLSSCMSKLRGPKGSKIPKMMKILASLAAMYDSLEPRDYTANSKHDSTSRHDSLLTDLES